VSVELRSAQSLSVAERVDLFNAAYEDYVIPFRLDENALNEMTRTFDLDVEASRVAFRDAKPVGFGNLGLRGDQAWIGGVGVIVSARRQGIGELLMWALHDEAARRVLRTLRGHGTVSVLNLPADDAAIESLRALGATATVRQREMVLDLQTRARLEGAWRFASASSHRSPGRNLTR
jgi:GNAT superfamily N-acetyltransferase